MWPNPQETAVFVTFTEEILNGKLHFLSAVFCRRRFPSQFNFVASKTAPSFSQRGPI